MIVGAYYEDTGGTDAGSAYIFKRGTGTETWSQQAKIQASDIAANDSFGYAVSIDGDTVVVGARQEDEGGTDAGAAYYLRGVERHGHNRQNSWRVINKRVIISVIKPFQ